jgi:hypothetical protein
MVERVHNKFMSTHLYVSVSKLQKKMLSEIRYWYYGKLTGIFNFALCWSHVMYILYIKLMQNFVDCLKNSSSYKRFVYGIKAVTFLSDISNVGNMCLNEEKSNLLLCSVNSLTHNLFISENTVKQYAPEGSNRIHGVISQKTEFFITTAVRTSNPTNHTKF